MTRKQQRFVTEYLIDCNATQAAIRAGYSESTARFIGAENLSKPYIRKAIDEQLEKMKSDSIATAEEIMQYLTSVLRGQSTSSVLSLCGDGCQEVIEKAPDEKERLKAAELLGKRYGIFNDKYSIDARLAPIVFVDDLPDDDDEYWEKHPVGNMKH